MEINKEQQQRGHHIFLDDENFYRWSSIKITEGVKTDSEVASILLKQYDKSHGIQTLESAVCCGQCNSQLSLVCGRCKPQTVEADSASDPDDPCESQPPIVYRLLHISPKDDGVDGASDTDSSISFPTEQCKHNQARSDDHLIMASAKEMAGGGKSIIIVDYFSKSKHDMHQMCPEDSIFATVQQSDGFAGENTVRVSLDVHAHPQYTRLQNVAPQSDYQYLQDGSIGQQFEPVGEIVTVTQTDGDHWMEQLLYGDTATQTVRRADTEAASAAAALEALSDVPFTATPVVKVKPRKSRGGKPIPVNRIRTCRICGRQCASPSDLKRHMMLHTGEKPYVCDDCGASFVQRGNWKRHKIEIHGSKNHLCPQCGVRFALVEDLQLHMRFHNSDRQHTCALCKSAFKSAHNLRKHMKTHTSNRPFQCTECGTNFATKRKLTMHRTTHTGEKLFRCGVCEAAFFDSKTRKQHKQAHKGTTRHGKQQQQQTSQMYIIPSQ